MMCLKDYAKQKCLKRFLSERLVLPLQSDITPLIDFLTHLLIEWLKKAYPYYSPGDEIADVRDKLTSKLWKEIEKTGEISVDQIANMLTNIYERDIKPQLESRLKSRGIVLFKEYEDVNTILKSRLRYETLKILARGWMSAKELSRRLGCREEVVRRFLSDIKRLNIVVERPQISSQGRPIKVYKLATPIVVIDLR